MKGTEVFGVRYLQQISSQDTGGTIHIEPGIWLNVPATTDPARNATVVRLAAILHSTAVLAQGSAFGMKGPPIFKPANTVPFPIGWAEPPPGTVNPFPAYNLATASQFRATPTTPPQVTQAAVTNPNSLLQAAIAHQAITETVVLNVSTTGKVPGASGGAKNIPFSGPHTEVGQVSATFWIEKVQHPKGRNCSFLQLQYTQTVLLNFKSLSWPHVTVATLIKVS
jgi:hypothetical protein